MFKFKHILASKTPLLFPHSYMDALVKIVQNITLSRGSEKMFLIFLKKGSKRDCTMGTYPPPNRFTRGKNQESQL
jgi:hypothetical protein